MNDSHTKLTSTVTSITVELNLINYYSANVFLTDKKSRHNPSIISDLIDLFSRFLGVTKTSAKAFIEPNLVTDDKIRLNNLKKLFYEASVEFLDDELKGEAVTKAKKAGNAKKIEVDEERLNTLIANLEQRIKDFEEIIKGYDLKIASYENDKNATEAVLNSEKFFLESLKKVIIK